MTIHVVDGGRHIYCDECIKEEHNPDADCFYDGCENECCGCGVCCDPPSCSCTGKGYVWHP